jgi:hypothetical protein
MHHSRSVSDSLSMSDSIDAKIGTSLATPLLAAAMRALAEAQAVTEWGDELQPAVVAILCAATALEAATNWEASAKAAEWVETRDRELAPRRRWFDLAPGRKWAELVEKLTGTPVDPSKGLGPASSCSSRIAT